MLPVMEERSRKVDPASLLVAPKHLINKKGFGIDIDVENRMSRDGVKMRYIAKEFFIVLIKQS